MPPAGRERRERISNVMREGILEAAERLLQQGGPESLSLRKIAAAVRYAPPSLYYYYSDKEAVLDALAVRHVAQISPLLEQAALFEPRDPVARLRAVCLAYSNWALDNPMLYLSLYRFCAECSEMGAKLLPIQILLTEPIVAAQKVGRMRRDVHPDRMTLTLWAGLHGFLQFAITLPDLQTSEPEAAAFAVDTLLRGMRGP